jgi:hypothetical protein
MRTLTKTIATTALCGMVVFGLYSHLPPTGEADGSALSTARVTHHNGVAATVHHASVPDGPHPEVDLPNAAVTVNELYRSYNAWVRDECLPGEYCEYTDPSGNEWTSWSQVDWPPTPDDILSPPDVSVESACDELWLSANNDEPIDYETFEYFQSNPNQSPAVQYFVEPDSYGTYPPKTVPFPIAGGSY